MTTPHFDYLTGLIAAAKKQASELAAHAAHHGLAGEIRELAAQQCIAPFLTQSFRCGTGKIIDTYQKTSSQVDIIVYHKKTAPPVLLSDKLGLFPVECVRYAFEVKSTITAGEIKDANKKFQALGELQSFPTIATDGTVSHGDKPSTVLLAFASDISGNELERYLKHTPPGQPPCTVLCVLGKGYWYYKENGEWVGLNYRQGLPEYVEFALFITGLMNTLSAEECSIKPFQPGKYLDAFAEVTNALGLSPDAEAPKGLLWPPIEREA